MAFTDEYSHPADVMSQGQPRAHFFSLPLEIRLCIYEHVLVVTSPVTICTHPRSPDLKLSLLLTCRQIYNEAHPIFYSKNTFKIEVPAIIRKWTIMIGQVNIKLLKSIFVELSEHDLYYLHNQPEECSLFDMFSLLARDATGLRYVKIGVVLFGERPATTDFERKLVKIREIERVDLHEVYGKHWPKYLAEMNGMLVEED
ncbi:MAG: hypothetical protein LQ351_004025 [Letrouitia transgressa]|nr:MAG: hypothetical protein LQ351_004025 [Letrouitia transgressa]